MPTRRRPATRRGAGSGRRGSSGRRTGRAAVPGASSRILGFGVALGGGLVIALTIAIVIAARSALLGGFESSAAAPTAASVSCPAAAPKQIGTVHVPAGPIAGYCQDQLINAAHIINAARALGIGTHTQAVGVMTAMGESSLVNVDHGDAVGPDSRGLFQQRDNGAWGSYTDRMTPFTAATSFFTKLVKVPGWQTMQPTLLAHTVQVNADPQHYASYWPAAVAVVEELSGPVPN
ncbi:MULTISPECIES: hypothetical protein [unclassified Frondihabitans]|uniref:hypothetical protein n=1 Tax=unclassified Frondihabitans TaxID=2626248 RepID=UPI000F4E4831|nr:MULTISPECIES: hypothetical protein [unclassified Frondihabitans]